MTTEKPPHARAAVERQLLIHGTVVEHERYLAAYEGLGAFYHPVKGGRHAVGTLAMLIGESRAGKTFVAKRFANSHPPTIGEAGMIMPVVYVDMPAEHVGGARAVLENIADALDLQYSLRMANQALMEAIRYALRDRRVELLILDEFEQVFREKDQRMANFGRAMLRKILNLNTLSVVCIGLTPTYHAIYKDEQLRGRGGLPYRQILPYNWGDVNERRAFRVICDAFDQRLPFEERSGLGRTEMAARLYSASEGNIGRLKLMIEAAAALAINDDAARIEPSHFATAYRDRMRLGESFNPFEHDLSLAPKAQAERARIKGGGATQVFSKKRERDLADDL